MQANRNFLTIVIAISICLLQCSFALASKRPIALVWSGKGACAEGCADAAAKVARLSGYEVKFVVDHTLSQQLLDSAAIWVQPGGDAIIASKSLGHERLAMIRDFVRAGGSYVGFCAGAFLADHWVDDENTIEGLGITPVVTADYAKEELGKNDVLLPVNWEGQLRSLYFSQGATFKPYAGNDVKVFATYAHPNLPQTPAAWQNRYGQGIVVVSGVHPEATSAWKRDSGLGDGDGDDSDLAQEMFEKAASF